MGSQGIWNCKEKPIAPNLPLRQSVNKKLKTSKKPQVNVEELKRQYSFPIRRKKLDDKFTNQLPVKSERELTDCEKDKQTELKMLADMKLENIFLNSDYFKLQSNNFSSLSFCSGDNAENRWTLDSSFEKLQAQARNLTGSSEPLKCDGIETKPRSKRNELIDPKMEKEGPTIGSSDVINVMSQQMLLAERELQLTRQHLLETFTKLNERDLEILRLQDKMEGSKNGEKKPGTSVGQDGKKNENDSDDYQQLVSISEKLKKQVLDMEEFLNDYGLVWVGDEDERKPDFDKILKNFKQLNAVASQPRIIQTTMGAKFELPREIPVTLYSNGMLLRNREFREYKKISTIQFLKDIEDGYFPSELQADYPEGVPFEVIDKREEVYNLHGNKRPVFQGQGYRLGSTFEGKPLAAQTGEPIRQTRVIDPHPDPTPGLFDRCYFKGLKRRGKPSRAKQDEYRNMVLMQVLAAAVKEKELTMLVPGREEPEEMVPTPPEGKLVTLKIRMGKDRLDSCVVQIMSNDLMSNLRKNLERKLCEKYHSELVCKKRSAKNNNALDFELHIYGKNPIRLSDCLNKYLLDCGITDNCVINVTEI